MAKNNRILTKMISYVIAVAGAILILMPFYVTLITAFKTPQESAQSFFSFPKSFYLENFKTVFAKAGYFNFFLVVDKGWFGDGSSGEGLFVTVKSL